MEDSRGGRPSRTSSGNAPTTESRAEGNDGGTEKTRVLKLKQVWAHNVAESVRAIQEKINITEGVAQSILDDAELKQKLEAYEYNNTLREAKSLRDKLKAAAAELEKAKGLHFEEKTKEVETLISAVQTAGMDVIAFDDICKGLVKTKNATVRREKAKNRYHLTKYQRHFRSQGHCNASRAKLGSELMSLENDADEAAAAPADQNPEDAWDPPEHFVPYSRAAKMERFDAPAVWVKELSPIKGYVALMDRAIASAESSLVATLVRQENQGMRGLMSPFDAGVSEEEKAAIEKFKENNVPEPYELGSKFPAWACAVRKYCLRTGNTAWPMPGFGAFIHTREFPIAVAIVNVTTLIREGGLQVFSQLDAALDSKAIYQKTWPVMHVPLGGTAWVPYGTVPMVIGTTDITTYSIIPWLNKQLWQITDKETADFILDMLEKHLKGQSDSKAFKVLAQNFGDFATKLKTGEPEE